MGQTDQPFDAVSGTLAPADLDQLRGAYKRDDMTKILVETLPKAYVLSTEYVEAIGDLLYSKMLPEQGDPGLRSMLSVQDRERCLVAVLASREAGLALAVHIYIALMEEVSPQEIAHILLLAGIYGGIDHLTGGLGTELQVLGALKNQIKTGGALDVNAIAGQGGLLSQVFKAA
jgi:alkylhydroperoxidase/carboxymuconolactone decarboxylase family protein YurZ